MACTFHHGDKTKSRNFGEDWRWLQSTPSSWTRQMLRFFLSRRSRTFTTGSGTGGGQTESEDIEANLTDRC